MLNEALLLQQIRKYFTLYMLYGMCMNRCLLLLHIKIIIVMNDDTWNDDTWNLVLEIKDLQFLNQC